MTESEVHFSQGLPPPAWSPSGNSGTWVWDEKGDTSRTGWCNQKNEKKAKKRPCWRWCDDVHGYEWYGKTNSFASSPKSKKKWWQIWR